MRSKVAKKSWHGIETKGRAESVEMEPEVSLMGSTEKKETSHLLGLIGRHQYSDQHSNPTRAPITKALL